MSLGLSNLLSIDDSVVIALDAIDTSHTLVIDIQIDCCSLSGNMQRYQTPHHITHREVHDLEIPYGSRRVVKAFNPR